MSFIKKNAWSIGFVLILVASFAAMVFASKNTKLPSATATAKDNAEFVISSDDFVKGSENAKATLVEFADFQCPACAAYSPLVSKLLEDFPNDLRVVYKNFPLTSIHAQAMNSAQAAIAAGLQGKFWEMHDLLFKNQSNWDKTLGKSVFDQYATELGLDLKKFKDDIDSNDTKERVKKDLNQAVDLGLNGTPSFYLNGKKISNPGTYEDFKALVQNAIGTSDTPTEDSSVQ